MILYEVRSGIITVLSVKRETECGWRKHSNGFINRSRPAEQYVDIDRAYYTADFGEACEWSKRIITRMTYLIQVGNAAASDIDFWIDGGAHEDDIPKSRMTYKG